MPASLDHIDFRLREAAIRATSCFSAATVPPRSTSGRRLPSLRNDKAASVLQCQRRLRRDRASLALVHFASKGEAARPVALEGDTVTVHFTVFGESGERLESTKDAGQPLTFEVGASEVIGNDLLNAFDGGVRGLSIGETGFQVQCNSEGDLHASPCLWYMSPL